MKTILLEEPGKLLRVSTAPPIGVAPGEAVVRVGRIGICGTDLHAFKGEQPFFSYPRVLGHELGVEIVAIHQADSGLAIGDCCAVEPYLNCGVCIACRRGKSNCCVRLQVLGVHIDGGMRELIRVPTSKLHKSQTLSLDQLALVEPLSIGAHAVERAGLVAGEFVLVIGAGPIGLSVMQFAQLADTQVIVMDVNTERLKFCQDHFGVRFVIDSGDEAIDRLQVITGGDMPTAVFDATGNSNSMRQSFNLVAHGGRLIFVGLVQGEVSFQDPDAHRRELTLLCSRNATGADFKRIIRMLEERKINITPWITHRAEFDRVTEQFTNWLDPKTKFIKALIEV